LDGALLAVDRDRDPISEDHVDRGPMSRPEGVGHGDLRFALHVGSAPAQFEVHLRVHL